MMTNTSRRNVLKGAAVAALGSATIQSTVQAQSAAPATDYEAFVTLSSVLTGLKEDELPVMEEQHDSTGTRTRLYAIYAERLHAAYPAEFGELLTVWRVIQSFPNSEAALSERLAAPGPAAQRLRLAGRQIIKIWYLSVIDDPRRPLDPQKKGKGDSQLGGDLGQYQHSAIWKLIGASVPGYSNAPHGYWSQQPNLS